MWTKLNWVPPPPVGLADLGGGAPPEMAGMTGMVSLMTAFVGRRPDAERIYRGFLGVELEEKDKKVFVARVLPKSPAAEAGLLAGDEIAKFQDAKVDSLAKLQKLAAQHASVEKLELEVLRAGKTETITVTPIQGL
jgi:S1-C subfamily serine protease